MWTLTHHHPHMLLHMSPKPTVTKHVFCHLQTQIHSAEQPRPHTHTKDPDVEELCVRSTSQAGKTSGKGLCSSKLLLNELICYWYAKSCYKESESEAGESLRAGERYHRWGTAGEEGRLCADRGWGWFVSWWCNLWDPFLKGRKCLCFNVVPVYAAVVICRICLILLKTTFSRGFLTLKTCKKYKTEQYTNLFAFLLWSCQSFAFDHRLYIGHRIHCVGHWSLLWLKHRKAGHRFPKLWNYQFLFCPKALNPA